MRLSEWLSVGMELHEPIATTLAQKRIRGVALAFIARYPCSRWKSRRAVIRAACGRLACKEAEVDWALCYLTTEEYVRKQTLYNVECFKLLPRGQMLDAGIFKDALVERV